MILMGVPGCLTILRSTPSHLLRRQTLPPNLSISLAGTNVIVSWPATGSYTLQQSANMAKFSWSPWGFPPVSNNGIYSITIPAPANTLFFRLSNP